MRPITWAAAEVLFIKSYRLREQVSKCFLFKPGKANANGGGSPYANDLGGFRKPSRLEALPGVAAARGDKNRKKSGPMLNTMGTF